jgi:alanine-synthesizing transaminase
MRPRDADARVLGVRPPVKFSGRASKHGDVNALTRVLEALRAEGTPIVDLTESNPTHAEIEYPPSLLCGLADVRGLSYDPEPFGLPVAREAVAAHYNRREISIASDQVVLSASTSEMYSLLFKLLCNPGDCVLVPTPSYPLFEHLTALEGVAAAPYRLEYHTRWDIDLASIAAAPERTRALLVVSPNNPTGSFVTMSEAEAIARLCRERGWALIADEVFAEYPLSASTTQSSLTARADVLSFSLGGLSKSLGLPQLKVAWAVVGGPPPDRAAALSRLELIADTFLSVGTPVQAALPDLFQQGASIRDAIHERVRFNLGQAADIGKRHPSCSVLPVEGGWSAVVRVPGTRDEESLTIDLLRSEHVLVHPGYFFDFPHEAFIVVSLLPPPERFAEAFDRVLGFASS